MVLLILLPKINHFFSENLPEYLEPKYKDDSAKESVEMSKTFSGSLLDNNMLKVDFNELTNKENVENQIQEFKKVLFEVADTYIETESAYDLVSHVVHHLIRLIGSIRPTIEGMEDFIIDNRRHWRDMKKWMGNPGGSQEEESNDWRYLSEKFLLNVEGMVGVQIGTLLENFKEILNRVDIEIETLRKRRTINLVYKEGNFHESKGAIKVGDYASFLSVDETEGKTTLIYSRNVSLVDKRTALRQANSICRSGFLLGNGRRIGMGCELVESEGNEEE
ncbi:MAG: hypothetical protein ACW981_04055 [Candidatus Hodarchaeales archaeon]|jgi:hypothetical protein